MSAPKTDRAAPDERPETETETPNALHDNAAPRFSSTNADDDFERVVERVTDIPRSTDLRPFGQHLAGERPERFVTDEPDEDLP